MSAHIQRKICLLGDGAVGKTSLIRKYVMDYFDDEYVATVGTKITKKEIKIKEPGKESTYMTIMIWDIVGQKECRDLHRMYYQGADGALIVCDLTRKKTFQSIREWADSLRKETGRVPVILIGNKSDVETSHWQVRDEDLVALSLEFRSPYFLTSAKNGENVEAAFKALAERMTPKKIIIK